MELTLYRFLEVSDSNVSSIVKEYTEVNPYYKQVEEDLRETLKELQGLINANTED